MVIYSVTVRPSAIEMLRKISDRRIREKIDDRINGLAIEPEKQGKELSGELEGYRSLRAVGQRYRIVYRIDGENVVVVVVALGICKEGDKKDVYKLTQRLFKLGLLEAPQEPEIEENQTTQDEPQEETYQEVSAPIEENQTEDLAEGEQ